MVEEYSSLKGLSEGLYKEKGSKFIAYATPVRSEDEVKLRLEEWKKLHPQARHLCYAYRLSPDASLYRANDDGEPNNSAGAPILGQIKSFELTDVLVGVVRYFGGTKLGVSGLIQAYKEAAKEAIVNGSVIAKKVEWIAQVSFNYEQMSLVMNVVKRMDLEVIRSEFELVCELELAVFVGIKDEFESNMNELREIDWEWIQKI